VVLLYASGGGLIYISQLQFVWASFFLFALVEALVLWRCIMFGCIVVFFWLYSLMIRNSTHKMDKWDDRNSNPDSLHYPTK
jgi:hypothetical protein